MTKINFKNKAIDRIIDYLNDDNLKSFVFFVYDDFKKNQLFPDDVYSGDQAESYILDTILIPELRKIEQQEVIEKILGRQHDTKKFSDSLSPDIKKQYDCLEEIIKNNIIILLDFMDFEHNFFKKFFPDKTRISNEEILRMILPVLCKINDDPSLDSLTDADKAIYSEVYLSLVDFISSDFTSPFSKVFYL